MLKIVKVEGTLKESQFVPDKKLYLCTLRGKPLYSASKTVKFECAQGTLPQDIMNTLLDPKQFDKIQIETI